MTTEETHRHFLRGLRASEDSKWRVGLWLTGKGYSVRLPPYREGPKFEDRRNYSDNGDLYVEMRVEVKHRESCQFTCREDFPFKDFMVCKVKTFDEARPRPYAWVHVNPPMSHVAIISAASRSRWSVRLVNAGNRPCGEQPHYFACLEDVHFQKLDLALWEQNS